MEERQKWNLWLWLWDSREDIATIVFAVYKYYFLSFIIEKGEYNEIQH